MIPDTLIWLEMEKPVWACLGTCFSLTHFCTTFKEHLGGTDVSSIFLGGGIHILVAFIFGNNPLRGLRSQIRFCEWDDQVESTATVNYVHFSRSTLGVNVVLVQGSLDPYFGEISKNAKTFDTEPSDFLLRVHGFSDPSTGVPFHLSSLKHICSYFWWIHKAASLSHRIYV